jgi:hypothetical protein
VAEEMSRGTTNRSLLPSALPCFNDDNSLPTPVVRLHIAIELICRFKLAQVLSVQELSRVDFLLDQLLSLKEVVAQLGGVVPHIGSELLGHKQVALLMCLATPDH